MKFDVFFICEYTLLEFMKTWKSQYICTFHLKYIFVLHKPALKLVLSSCTNVHILHNIRPMCIKIPL